MAGFDPTLDKEMFSQNVNIADNLRIKVSVMSYNDGLPKMQISRERKNREGEWGFAKLGRMTVDEVTVVMPVMQKAKEFMEKLPKEEAATAEAPSESKE